MAAPTNAAYVKKALANSEPSTHGTFETSNNVRYTALSRIIRTLSGHGPRAEFDPKATSGRHPNKPFQSGIVSLSAGWVGRMRRREFLGVLGGAAATLAVCTTVLNAADEKAFEKALLGHIMWSAFQCSTYAELSDYKSEQERLHLVGLNAGRTFLEAMKAGQISEQALREAVPINVLQRLEGPSNEVIIDKIYAAATGYARDYIVKRKTGIWGPTEKQEARSYYTNHNCILIR